MAWDPLPDTAWWRAFQGRFQGLLDWPAVDDLWRRLAGAGGEWWVWELDGDLPAAPLSGDDFAAALARMGAMYDDEVRRRSHAGTVYVDDPADPAFVKVFDPWKMGAVCGSSGERILPRYVVSRMAPDAPLPEPAPPPRPGLLARLLRRG